MMGQLFSLELIPLLDSPVGVGKYFKWLYKVGSIVYLVESTEKIVPIIDIFKVLLAMDCIWTSELLMIWIHPPKYSIWSNLSEMLTYIWIGYPFLDM